MTARETACNSKYLFIVLVLRDLLNRDLISKKEFERSKDYYKRITGAKIYLIDCAERSIGDRK